MTSLAFESSSKLAGRHSRSLTTRAVLSGVGRPKLNFSIRVTIVSVAGLDSVQQFVKNKIQIDLTCLLHPYASRTRQPLDMLPH